MFIMYSNTKIIYQRINWREEDVSSSSIMKPCKCYGLLLYCPHNSLSLLHLLYIWTHSMIHVFNNEN
jgi:hypothetical protein